MGAYEMGGFSLTATDRRDCQPLGLYCAVLAPDPDFALPMASAYNGVPQRAIERSDVMPGSQDVGCISYQVALRIAGVGFERRVDALDDGVCVCDDHCLLRFKCGGSNPQFGFCTLALGNVGAYPAVAPECSVTSKNRVATDADKGLAPFGVEPADLEIAEGLMGFEGRAVVRPAGCVRPRMWHLPAQLANKAGRIKPAIAGLPCAGGALGEAMFAVCLPEKVAGHDCETSHAGFAQA